MSSDSLGILHLRDVRVAAFIKTRAAGSLAACATCTGLTQEIAALMVSEGAIFHLGQILGGEISPEVAGRRRLEPRLKCHTVSVPAASHRLLSGCTAFPHLTSSSVEWAAKAMEAGVGCGNEPDTFIYVTISLTLCNVYMTTSSFLRDLDSEEEARVVVWLSSTRHPDFSCWGHLWV